MTVIPPHKYDDQAKLETVMAEMQTLGAPTIKAVWIPGHGAWMALEGSHRIEAAKRLGLTPIIQAIEFVEDATTDEVIPGSYQDTHTLGELVDNAWRIQPVEFADPE